MGLPLKENLSYNLPKNSTIWSHLENYKKQNIPKRCWGRAYGKKLTSLGSAKD